MFAFGRRLLAESLEDRLPGLAAEIAFFAVLGVFPALLLAAGLLGVLGDLLGNAVGVNAQRQLVDTLDTLLTTRAAPVVASVQKLFQVNAGRLLSVAALGGLVTVSGAVAVVIEALNLAYDVPEHRGWLRRRLLGLAMGLVTVVAAAVALAVLVVGPLFGSGRDLAGLVGLGDEFTVAWSFLKQPALAVGLVLWTATLFRLAPNQPGRWRDELPGAVLTTVLWIASTWGLHFYVVLVARTNPVLGAFGGGLIVLLWAYLLALALLVGGEFNATRLRRGRPRSRPGPRGRRGADGRVREPCAASARPDGELTDRSGNPAVCRPVPHGEPGQRR